MRLSYLEPVSLEGGMNSALDMADAGRIVAPSRTGHARFKPRATADAAIVSASSRLSERRNWCQTPVIFAFCLAPPLLLLIVSLFMDLGDPTWPAQFVLGISSLCSLLILGDRPLLNPVQSVVLLFQWWFGCGPAICGAFYYAIGDADSARLYLDGQSGSVWVVALGVLVYALCARLTLNFARRTRLGMPFLLPSGTLYSPRTLIAYAVVAACVYAFLFVLGRFGIRAFQTTDYLGGQLTTSPLLAAVNSVMRLGQFATVGVLGYLAVPTKTNWRALRIVVVIVIAVNMGTALSSGSKGAIVLPLFYLGLLLFTYKQRAPWVLFLSMMALYMVFVEPFVASSRVLAQSERLATSEDRVELFQEQLKNFHLTMPDWRQINIESPFRGVYTNGVQISSMSNMFSGPWAGESLRNGFSAVVPRFLDPGKAESNMGNFFAHELGTSSYENDKNNIAISIPFEVVGNYGFVAGVLSFGVIGIFWTFFVCLLLSEARLATHPLMPLCVTIMLTLESSVGQFLNGIKDLPIALATAWLVWFVLERRQNGRVRRVLPA
jgi:hypothetical protein